MSPFLDALFLQAGAQLPYFWSPLPPAPAQEEIATASLRAPFSHPLRLETNSFRNK